jgi:hypothetical protein
MKREIAITIMLTVILAMSTLPVKTQEISSGIKGGLTMSNFYIDVNNIDDENARFGFHAGLFTQVMYLKVFGIQPELLYTAKGTTATYGGLINQTVDFNLNYLEIPILLVLRPLDILEFHVGPWVGLLLSSNIKYSGTIEGYDEISRDNFNTLDYGIGAGAALNLGNIQAGVRYNFGLRKLADSDIANLLLGDSKNSFGQLYIALRFF